MEFHHVSVLLNECIDNLNIKPDGVYVDCTMGGAGHSKEIVKRLSDKGLFIGFDQDKNDILFGLKNDIDFNVVSSDDDGKWKSALTGTMPAGSSVHREYFSYDSSFSFDGERLVVWVFEQPGMEDTQILSLQPDVMVFTENGLQYYCKWLCSLGDPVANVVRWEAVSVGEWRIMLR